jgi:histidinol-phosphate/aromatic aminotransferase/cobyric acid decarboxylase-like protein
VSLAPEATRVPPAEGHGGDGASVARAMGVDPSELLDLSASLNPLASDPTVIVASHLASLRTYPDSRAVAKATEALASCLGVAADRVLLTNGGAEAISLVAAELGRGWVEDPEFSLYRRHLARLEPGAPRFRSNPRNPTGRLAGPGDRAQVWDEAFYPLSTGSWTRRDFDEGSLVIGSLTKLLACPGLRVGYVVTPDADGRSRLARRQPEWALNALAAESLPELLSTVDLTTWAAAVAELRADLVEILSRHGLAAWPSDAPFVLFDAATGFRERLARHGVLVRDCASFGLRGVVRAAVPDAGGLETLERALGALGAESWTGDVAP